MPGLMKFTVDKDLLTETLTDFPVMINLAASSNLAAADLTQIFRDLEGNNLRFKVWNADFSAQLYCEVATWDYANAIGELYVKTTLSHLADTIIWVEWDASWEDNTDYIGVTGSAPAQAVWDDNYVLVYHMNDNPANATQVLDSAGSFVASKKGKGEPVEVAGVIGKAQHFDGSNDYLTNTSVTAPTTITLEFYYTQIADAVSPYYRARMAHQWGSVSTAYSGWILQHSAARTPVLTTSAAGRWGGGGSFGATTLNTPTLLTFTQTPTVCTRYKDGVFVATNAGNYAPYAATVTFQQGQDNYTPERHVHEVRYSSVARSAPWIAATNKSLRDILVTGTLASYYAGQTLRVVKNLGGFSGQTLRTVKAASSFVGQTIRYVILTPVKWINSQNSQRSGSAQAGKQSGNTNFADRTGDITGNTKEQ